MSYKFPVKVKKTELKREYARYNRDTAAFDADPGEAQIDIANALKFGKDKDVDIYRIFVNVSAQGGEQIPDADVGKIFRIDWEITTESAMDKADEIILKGQGKGSFGYCITAASRIPTINYHFTQMFDFFEDPIFVPAYADVYGIVSAAYSAVNGASAAIFRLEWIIYYIEY